MPLRPLVLVVTLALAVPLSGCLGDTGTPPVAPAEASGEADQDLSAPAHEHRTVPVWSVGDTWRYRVEGARVGVPFTATFGVLSVEHDHYRIGADHPDEVVLDVVHGGLFTRGVERDRLAVWNSGAWQDLIGLGRAEGEPWSVELYGHRFLMESSSIAGGSRSTGTAPGGHGLVVEYLWADSWVTRFEWTADDGLVLGYRLLDRGGAADVWAWHVEPVASAVASALGPVQSGSWTSDGSARFLVITAHLEPTAAGRATVWDPSVRAVLAASAQASDRVKDAVVVSDKAGEWRLVSTSLGGPVEVTVHRVVPDMSARAEKEAPSGVLRDPIGTVVDTVDGLTRTTTGLL